MKRIDIDDAVSRYVAGESAKGIADSHGISLGPVIRQLKAAGVYQSHSGRGIRRRSSLTIAEADVLGRYEAGESEQAIARSAGCTRDSIREILTRHGVSARGRRAAGLIRAAKLSPEQRLALAEAAHAAVRGVPQSREHRLKIARSRERNRSVRTPIEDLLAANLRAFGIETSPQKAIGPYNVDVALTRSSIAVEVFGGHWHGSGHHAARHRQRFDDLIDWGWLPIVVWVTAKFPLSDAAIDYIVAWHQRRCRGETGGRQEHVIRGDGEGGPIGDGQPHGVPLVAGPKGRQNTRRNDRCPR
jgi:G:T-mismatch repair DNA endonuclease (very short patch repair protein)